MPSEELDDLFSTPPAAFVEARNALVRSLKAAGRRDEAVQVAALARPAPAVWAVNQIARRAPALVVRLGELTAQLQRAGGSAGYAELVNEHRELLKALREKGAELLASAGLRASPEVLARFVHNLRAGMADPETRRLVELGRLERDVESQALASGFVPPPAAAPAATPPVVSPAPDQAAARERARLAEAQARAAARALAQERIERLREALGAARTRQSAEEVEQARAQAALAEAAARLSSARADVAQATADLARAEAELDALAR